MSQKLKELSGKTLTISDINVFERLFWVIIVLTGVILCAVVITEEVIDWINPPTRKSTFSNWRIHVSSLSLNLVFVWNVNVEPQMVI